MQILVEIESAHYSNRISLVLFISYHRGQAYMNHVMCNLPTKIDIFLRAAGKRSASNVCGCVRMKVTKNISSCLMQHLQVIQFVQSNAFYNQNSKQCAFMLQIRNSCKITSMEQTFHLDAQPPHTHTYVYIYPLQTPMQITM